MQGRFGVLKDTMRLLASVSDIRSIYELHLILNLVVELCD
jgi:hypothetical protein